jgi:lipopolysaccharide export system permease protein
VDTLDRYLIRETTVFLFWILLGLALLFLGIDFLTNFWRSPHPISTTTLQYLYRIPSAIQLFIPVACLMATLLVLTGMSKQNEVLALYASGVSTLRIVSTFVALIATVSTIGFLILDPIMPVYARKQILLAQGLDPASSENLSSFNRTNFWYRSGRLVYNFGQFIPQANQLRDIKVYLFSPSFYLLERIHAEEAHFENEDWVLKNGTIITYPPDTEYPVSIPFKTKHHVIPEKPKDFKTLEIRDDTMRLRDLRQYILKNRQYGLDTTHQQVSYHERVALVFTPLILILLGFPFALQPLKTHSTARSVAYCFGIVFLYLLMSRLSISVGKSGHISPLFAAWAPNFLFLGVSSFRLMRS